MEAAKAAGAKWDAVGVAAALAPTVGRGSLPASKPELNARLLSALETYL